MQKAQSKPLRREVGAEAGVSARGIELGPAALRPVSIYFVMPIVIKVNYVRQKGCTNIFTNL